jgi:hypothetical protein
LTYLNYTAAEARIIEPRIEFTYFRILPEQASYDCECGCSKGGKIKMMVSEKLHTAKKK